MFKKEFWNYGLGIHLSFVTLVATLAYLDILPTTYKVIPRFDLLGHFFLIGLLAFFLDGALNFRPLIPGKWHFLRVAPLLLLAIAAIEESAQAFSPHRTSSMSDFMADALGVVCFSAFARYLAESEVAVKEM